MLNLDKGRNLVSNFLLFFKPYLNLLCHLDQPCIDAKLNLSILVEQRMSSEAVITEHVVW